MLSWAVTDPWVVLLRYEAGVFRFFIMSAMGTVDGTAERLLTTFRGAAAFKAAGRDLLLYWSEPSGGIYFPGMLAVAVVEPGHSAFVSTVDQQHVMAEYADLERWFGSYLADCVDQHGLPAPDGWSRAAYADANFVKIVRHRAPPRA